MKHTIRAMTEADGPAVLEMMRTFYASPAVLTNGSEEIFQADLAACVGDSPYLEGYIFEVEGQIAGYGMVAKSFSTEFGKPCIWVEDAYVQEAYRGLGIGTNYLHHVAQRYPQAILRLEVERENEKAVRVYEACGFQELPYMEMKRDSQSRDERDQGKATEEIR